MEKQSLQTRELATTPQDKPPTTLWEPINMWVISYRWAGFRLITLETLGFGQPA